MGESAYSQFHLTLNARARVAVDARAFLRVRGQQLSPESRFSVTVGPASVLGQFPLGVQRSDGTLGS